MYSWNKNFVGLKHLLRVFFPSWKIRGLIVNKHVSHNHAHPVFAALVQLCTKLFCWLTVSLGKVSSPTASSGKGWVWKWKYTYCHCLWNLWVGGCCQEKNSWAAELSWKPLLKVTCILVILNKAQGSTNIGIYWEPPCTQMYQWLTGWNIHTDFCQEHKSIFFLPEKRYWLYCYEYVAFNLYSSINWALGFLIK